MNNFRIHIVIVLLFIIVETGFSLQRADRRTGYVPHSDRIGQLEDKLKTARGANRNDVLLALAGEHYKQAQLYTLLWLTTASIGELYYAIMDENDVDAGIASDLYRGIGYFELGKYAEAEKMLNSFLLLADNLPQQLRNEGKAWLGAVHYVRGNEQNAIENWNSIPASVRNACSTVAYVQARVGYNLDGLRDNCPADQIAGEKQTIPQMEMLVSTGQFELLPELINKKTFDAAYVEQKGSEGELRYFNPSEIVTLSHAHYALAAYYARDASSAQKKRFYDGAFYFYTGRYDKAIDVLEGSDDLTNALYLAAAYYNSGRQTIAQEVFDYIEAAGDNETVRRLHVMYALLDIKGRNKNVMEAFDIEINSQQSRQRRNVPHDTYKKLGLVYFYNEEYDKALDVLGAAFRTERRDDLRVNSPEFMILYGSSIVMAKNFISLSDALDMFSTVMRAYPHAEALVEVTSLIDVVTNIGREGRIIYRR